MVFKVSTNDESLALRRITIKERHAEFLEAAESCFTLLKNTQDSSLAIRGVKNLVASSWQAESLEKMDARLEELISRIHQVTKDLTLSEEQKKIETSTEDVGADIVISDSDSTRKDVYHPSKPSKTRYQPGKDRANDVVRSKSHI